MQEKDIKKCAFFKHIFISFREGMTQSPLPIYGNSNQENFFYSTDTG